LLQPRQAGLELLVAVKIPFATMEQGKVYTKRNYPALGGTGYPFGQVLSAAPSRQQLRPPATLWHCGQVAVGGYSAAKI